MFSNLGWPEFAVLVVIGLFVVGPDRFPQVLSDLLRTLTRIRNAATSATAELREELALDQLARDVRRDFGLDEGPTVDSPTPRHI